LTLLFDFCGCNFYQSSNSINEEVVTCNLVGLTNEVYWGDYLKPPPLIIRTAVSFKW
jgi:hypothetical protein